MKHPTPFHFSTEHAALWLLLFSLAAGCSYSLGSRLQKKEAALSAASTVVLNQHRNPAGAVKNLLPSIRAELGAAVLLTDGTDCRYVRPSCRPGALPFH